jgi:hypothetical protein
MNGCGADAEAEVVNRWSRGWKRKDAKEEKDAEGKEFNRGLRR